MQARSGARVLVSGSLDMFSNAFFTYGGFETVSGRKCAQHGLFRIGLHCVMAWSTMYILHTMGIKWNNVIVHALFEAVPGLHARMLSKAVQNQNCQGIHQSFLLVRRPARSNAPWHIHQPTAPLTHACGIAGVPFQNSAALHASLRGFMRGAQVCKVGQQGVLRRGDQVGVPRARRAAGDQSAPQPRGRAGAARLVPRHRRPRVWPRHPRAGGRHMAAIQVSVLVLRDTKRRLKYLVPYFVAPDELLSALGMLEWQCH